MRGKNKNSFAFIILKLGQVKHLISSVYAINIFFVLIQFGGQKLLH